MHVRHLLPIAILTLAPLQLARADEIVRWVDENGTTHFGNPQLGPTDAEVVEVAPANGMDVPELPARAPSTGPVTVVLEKPPNRTLKGWRGHQWNVSRRPSRNNGR